MLFFVHKKWKLYLYLNGVCVKKIKLNDAENPKFKVFPTTIWFKKYIYGSNKVNVVVRPTKLIFTDNKHKITHWEFKYEEGTDI